MTFEIAEMILDFVVLAAFLMIYVLQRKSEERTEKRKKEINAMITNQNEVFKKHTESLEHVKEIFRRESQNRSGSE